MSSVQPHVRNFCPCHLINSSQLHWKWGAVILPLPAKDLSLGELSQPDKGGTPSQLCIPTSESSHCLPGTWLLFSSFALFCFVVSPLLSWLIGMSPRRCLEELCKPHKGQKLGILLTHPNCPHPTRIALPSSSCPSLTWWRWLEPQLEGLKASV